MKIFAKIIEETFVLSKKKNEKNILKGVKKGEKNSKGEKSFSYLVKNHFY